VIRASARSKRPRCTCTFNMGIGMVLVCPEYYSEASPDAAPPQGAHLAVGEVIRREKDEVEFV